MKLDIFLLIIFFFCGVSVVLIQGKHCFSQLFVTRSLPATISLCSTYVDVSFVTTPDQAASVTKYFWGRHDCDIFVLKYEQIFYVLSFDDCDYKINKFLIKIHMWPT